MPKIDALNVYGEQITSSPGPMSNCIQAALNAFVPFTVVKQCFEPCIPAHLFSNSETLRLRDHTPFPIISFILGLNFSAFHCGQFCHFLSPRTECPPKRAGLSEVSLEFPKTGVIPETVTPVVAVANVPTKLRRLISLVFMTISFIILHCDSMFFYLLIKLNVLIEILILKFNLPITFQMKLSKTIYDAFNKSSHLSQIENIFYIFILLVVSSSSVFKHRKQTIKIRKSQN